MPSFVRLTLFAIALSVLTVSLPILSLTAQAAPAPGQIALVVAAPWGPTPQQIIARAPIVEVSPTRAPLGALVMITSEADIANLYAQGALFVLNGEQIFAFCQTGKGS